MTETERETLARSRPSFIWRAASRRHQEELAQAECRRYRGRVRRAWDISECSPGCCPNMYLLDMGDDEYLLLESWNHLEKVDECFPGADMDIRCSMVSHRILSAITTGLPVALEATSIKEIAPASSREGCVIIRGAELTAEMRRVVGAVEQ